MSKSLAAVLPRWRAMHAIINRIAGAALVGTLLAGAAPAYADTGNDLVKDCRWLDRPAASAPHDGSWFLQGVCAGYAEAAYEAVLALQSAVVWSEQLVCVPKEGLEHGVVTEIFARYLVNHPEQRHLPGVMLMSEALKQAFPCKRE